MPKILEKLKEKFLEALPPTIFFFVALNIIALIRALLLKGTPHADASSEIEIVVLALILGKSVLIADLLPWINRFPDRPLIYNVAWKTAIYLLIATFIHLVERLIDFSGQVGSLAAGYEKLLSQTIWPHFLAVEIFLLVLTLMYCTARELVRVMGRDKVMRMFFGPMPLTAF
jgi:hypothetical protein